MSLTYRLVNCTGEELLDFIGDEIAKDTGLPVHPFSVVNAALSCFDKTVGLSTTKDDGTLFLCEDELTAYGCGNNAYESILTALRRCNAEIKFVW